MLRGLVVLNQTQIKELIKVVSIDKFKDSMLYVKLVSASKQHMDIVPIEFSEEEVELILDEMEPDPNNEVRNILTTTVISWRS